MILKARHFCQPDFDRALAACYRSGATLHELALVFGMHHTTIWRHLKKHGTRLRKKGRPKKRRPMV